jgi:hypothetical protein
MRRMHKPGLGSGRADSNMQNQKGLFHCSNVSETALTIPCTRGGWIDRRAQAYLPRGLSGGDGRLRTGERLSSRRLGGLSARRLGGLRERRRGL